MTWKTCAECGSKRRAVVFLGGGDTCRLCVKKKAGAKRTVKKDLCRATPSERLRHWKAKASKSYCYRKEDTDLYRAVCGCDPPERLFDRSEPRSRCPSPE